MSHKGSYAPGTMLFLSAHFHNDQGTAEDPISPTAVLRKPDGTFVSLGDPTKQNATTGWFGTSVDTTGFANGLYEVDISGTVSTSKVVGAVFSFQIEAVRASDAKASADTAVAQTDTLETEVAAIKAKTDNLPSDPASNTQVNTRLAAADYTAPDNTGISNIVGYVDTLETSMTTVLNDLTTLKNYTDTLESAVAAIQADLGDPSADTTTLYAQILAVKGFVDDLESMVLAIKIKTDNLNFNADTTPKVLVDVRDVNDTAVAGVNDFKADVSTLALETTAQAVKTKTDQLSFTDGRVDANASANGSTIKIETGTDQRIEVG